MLQKIIHSLFARRHFWRHATFSEIAELYASRMLRVLAFNMSMAFISIYLFQNGYSVPFIAAFWGAFYVLKVVISLPLAAVVAYIGPKHSILISNLLYIPAMIAFALLPQYGSWLLIVTTVFQATSVALYVISHAVDFSKVKSVDHAGKEIAYMNIIEKVMTGLGPLIGGLIAFLFGPQVVILVGAALFASAAVPLLRTGEPIARLQRIRLRTFPWRLVRRSFLAETAVGFDAFVSGTAWTLFVTTVIIGVTSDNSIYAFTGLLLSVVLFSALIASYAYGKLIDRRRGGDLMKFAALGNVLTHLSRPFVTTPIQSAGVNVLNEAATSGYTMAFTRGLFDAADLSGQRVLYIGAMEAIANFGAAIAAFTLALLTMLYGDTDGLRLLFVIAAAFVLLILTARFPLYQK